MADLLTKELPIWVWLVLATVLPVAFYLAMRWWLYEESRTQKTSRPDRH